MMCEGGHYNRVFLRFARFSPPQHHGSGGGARERERGGEEPSGPDLRGLRHSAARHHLVEGPTANQSHQLGARPLW